MSWGAATNSTQSTDTCSNIEDGSVGAIHMFETFVQLCDMFDQLYLLEMACHSAALIVSCF